jgi:colanic acid biosynthesis protein WcaH
MLDAQTFKTVIENTPLVSIDLCLVCDGQILLAKRNNEPLKGEWFTPGGRIYKNETWQKALLRIVEVELGLPDVKIEAFSLMGLWDHFYSNSVVDENISTHYVNMPHYADFQFRPSIIIDDQHGEFNIFCLNAPLSLFHFISRLLAYSVGLSRMFIWRTQLCETKVNSLPIFCKGSVAL